MSDNTKSLVAMFICAFALGWVATTLYYRPQRKQDVATMLQHDAQWREDCVAAGCAAWVTLEDGKVEWQWAERGVAP